MLTHRRTSWHIVTNRNWKTDALCIFFITSPSKIFTVCGPVSIVSKKNITFFYNYHTSKRFPGDRRGLRRWKGRAYRGLCSVIITVVVFDQNNNERLKTRTRPMVRLAELQPYSYSTRKLEFLVRWKLFRRCAAQTPRGRRRESMASTDIFLSSIT